MLATTLSPAPGDTVGGYRLVRILGRHERAMTALAHAAGQTVVLRVFEPGAADADIDGELAARDAVQAEQVVAVLDLASTSDGRVVVVLGHVPGPTLESLLAERAGQLSIGQAVTILAPIATALEAAHDAGVTAMCTEASSIRIDASGAPVILDLADARVGAVLPPRFRPLEPAYRADEAALARLCDEVAACVRPAEAAGLRTALVRARSAGTTTAHALFDLAEPQALSMVGASAGSGTHGAGLASPTPLMHERRDADESWQSGSAQPLAQPGPPALPRSLAAALDAVEALGVPLGVVEALTSMSERLVDVLRALVGRVAGFKGSSREAVRPRFVLAGAVGALALIGAIALGLMSADGGDPGGVVVSAEPGPTASSSPGSSATDGAGSSSASGSASDSDRASDESARAPESWLDPQPDQWPLIIGELVGRWNECIESALPGCTARAAQAGTAAASLLADAGAAEHGLLATWAAGGREAVVVERMGGAVLVDLVGPAGTTTASLLVMRSDAGWRVRDVIG